MVARVRELEGQLEPALAPSPISSSSPREAAALPTPEPANAPAAASSSGSQRNPRADTYITRLDLQLLPRAPGEEEEAGMGKDSPSALLASGGVPPFTDAQCMLKIHGPGPGAEVILQVPAHATVAELRRRIRLRLRTAGGGRPFLICSPLHPTPLREDQTLLVGGELVARPEGTADAVGLGQRRGRGGGVY